MTPLQLRYFVEIARSGSVSVAAAKLCVTQPSLSHHLAMLENELGVAVVIRHPRGITLTMEGHRLLARAVEILNQIDGLRDFVKQNESDPCGEVRLCLADSVAAALTGDVYMHVQRRYPAIKLIVSTAMSARAKQLILDRQLDLALIPNAFDIPDLHAIPALQETFSLYLSRSHWPTIESDSITLESASRLPLALPTHQYDIRRFLEREASARGLTLNVAFDIDNAEVARSLVRSGLACGIWPARGWPESRKDPTLEVKTLGDPPIERTLSLVWFSDAYQSAAAVAVRNLLLSILQP